MNIDKAINLFLDGQGKNRGHQPDERYSSFDYCYNYFYTFYRENKQKEIANQENIQLSCLHLGFYLASWGMMRGSSFLLEKSSRHYIKLIKVISEMPSELWEIDVDKYTIENIEKLLQCKEDIIEALKTDSKKPTDTLVTKIMLGVFANTPAFDSFFRKSFGIYKFNKDSLCRIKGFYEKNKDEIDKFEIKTYNFLLSEKNSAKTDIIYTKAKLIDMYGFMNGQIE